MTPTWYDTTYRKLFFDFHSPGATVGLAADFDAERWATRLVAANAQAVSVFTKCGYGYSFYDRGTTRHRHPQLRAGLDMLADQITALHAHGLRAIGYYHTFNSEPIARDHPEWRRHDAEGRPQGIEICLLSPLLDTWMLPHIEEIVTNYAVDSMFFDGTISHAACYCAACSERYTAASGGKPIPTEQDGDDWRAYVTWHLDALREVRAKICATIHRHRPEIIVSFNWAFSPRAPEAVPQEVGALVADIMPDDQVFNGSFFSAYWATLDRPFDIMNSAFLQWWGDWGCKPALAMQQELASVLAYGGRSWIGYQMTQAFDVEPAILDELGKTLRFVQEREPLLQDAQPLYYAGVLHSTTTVVAADQPGMFVDQLGARGAHRMLNERMIPHHFFNETGLLAHLDELRLVILPDQRSLAPALVAALAVWVENGGVLIATGLTGTHDATGHDTGGFALGDLVGIRREGIYDQNHAYVEVTEPLLLGGALAMPHIAQATWVFGRPIADDVRTLAKLRQIYLREDGKSLLQWSPPGPDSGYPAITLRHVGAGYAVYVAGDIFRAYQARNQWNLKHIMANVIGLTVPSPLVVVESSQWVQVVLATQPHTSGGARTIVHLINQHGDRPSDGNYRCTENIPPVRDVVVRLRLPEQPQAVRLEPAGTIPEYAYESGTLTVSVPEVAIHVAIVVEG